MNPEEYQRLFEVEASHWWYSGMRQILRAIVESVGDEPRSGLRTLDAGCGTGFDLAELGEGAVGVDVSEHALGLCRARGLTNAVRASIEALPFGDAAFDRVQALDVLYHAQVGDDRRAVRELARVLAAPGLMLIRVPALEVLRRSHDERVATARRYTKRELVRLLEEAGLRVLRATYCNSLLLPLVLVRALGDRAGLSGRRSDLDDLPPLVEAGFRRCLAAEARVLRHHDLPLGSSVVAVARKLTGPR